MTSPRPETIKDLTTYERTETLALFTVDSQLAKAGLLGNINDVIASIVAARGDTVEVKIETTTITVLRPLTDEELQAKLVSAQKLWDSMESYRKRQATAGTAKAGA